MIKVIFYKNADGDFVGFKSMGHAGAGEYGQDIVCSAISVLIINTVNAIEKFTHDKPLCKVDAKKMGYISFRIKGDISAESQLLLKTLHLGIEGVMSENKKYIKLKILEIKEV